METLERLKNDYSEIDEQIEAGHTYAQIFLLLSHAKDQFQRQDMEATLQALFENSFYIRAVFDSHDDPVSFLASRGPSHKNGSDSPNRILEQSESYI